MIAGSGTHSVRVRIVVLPPTFTSPVNFTVSNPVPNPGTLGPSLTPVGSGPVTLTWTGSNFTANSVGQVSGVNLATTFVSATQIQGILPASMTTVATSFTTAVFNPPPGGGTGSGGLLLITNPVPGLRSISPAIVNAGAAAFTLTANGNNFNTQTEIQISGAGVPTTFVNANQVTTTVAASLVVGGGTHSITIRNPPPGGGTTLGHLLLVNNPVPTAISLSPTNAVATQTTTVTVTGTNYNPTSVVRMNGTALPTTLLSPTQLQAPLVASEALVGSNVNISVFNPSPAGGTSVSLPMAVVNPLPGLSGISPSSVTAASPSFTLTANGGSFMAGSTIRIDGAPMPTNFVSSSQLTCAVPASLIQSGGNRLVTVFTGPPGGGLSNTNTLTVTNPSPTVSFFNPPTAQVGSAPVVMSVFGAGFTGSSVVKLGALSLSTTFVATNQLDATIPASAMTVAGLPIVSVVNPTPGGGTAAGAAFAINNNVPVATSLSPASVVVGGPTPVALTVNGSLFVSGTSVLFDGTAITTAFVSSSVLVASLPGALVAAPGIHQIGVETGPPGGGSGGGLTFTVNSPVPVATSVSPPLVFAGDPDTPVVISGSAFLSGCVVELVGIAQATPTQVAPTQITVPIPAFAMQTTGTIGLRVHNPAPTLGPSAIVALSCVNPAPTIAGLSPVSIPGGSPSFTLQVFGAHFQPTTAVAAGAIPLATTFVNAGLLSIVVPAGLLRETRVWPIIVTTPVPGGGAAVSSLTVDGPAITGASPAVVPVLTPASAPFTITIGGGPFSGFDQVRVNGVARPTTVINPSTLSFTVDPTMPVVLQPGGVNLTVTRPGPAGLVVSNAFGLPVGNGVVPDNAGAVTLAPVPPGPGASFDLRVEVPAGVTPVTLIAEAPAPSPFILNLAPGFDLAVGPGLGSPVVLADGLGIFGPPTGTTTVPDPLSSFGVPGQRSLLELMGIVAPPVPLGITFSLAAVYLTGASPIGLNATHVSGPYSL